MKKNLAIIGGFGADNTKDLREALTQSLPNIAQSEIIIGCPPLRALQHPQSRIAAIRERLQRLTKEHPTIVIGHSYGALLGLTAAAELGFENMPIGLYINGPLNPDIEIPIPDTKPQFALFRRQFNLRDETAQNCAAIIEQIHPSITQQHYTLGSKEDRIVPHSAHNMPGLPHLDFEGTSSHSLSKRKIDQIIQLLAEHDV
jgi:hypothetical protein